MKIPPSLSGLVLICSLVSTVHASELDAKIQNVRTVSEQLALAGMASKSANTSGIMDSTAGVSQELREISSTLSQMDSYLASNNYDEARRMVMRVLRSTKNEDLKKALQGLLSQIDAEQMKQAAVLEEKFAALNQKVNTALEKATPEQVSSLQEEVEDFRYTELNSGNRRNQRIGNRIDRMNNFLGQWQQLLEAEKDGNYAEALQILANMRSNRQSYRLPESLVTARKQALEEKILSTQEIKDALGPLHGKIAALIAAIKTPRDAIAVQQKISALENAQRSNVERTFYNQLSNNLQEYANLVQRYEEGDFYGVASSRTSDRFMPADLGAPLMRKRAELRILAMEKLFDLPALGLPEQNESLATFLAKKAEAAFKAGQWQSLYSLMSAYQLTVTTPCSTSSLAGVENMLAAIALESAGQQNDAMIAYRNVLRQPGKLAPRKAAAEALQKLQAAAPAATTNTPATNP